MSGAHLRVQPDRAAPSHRGAQLLYPFQRLPIGDARGGEAGGQDRRRVLRTVVDAGRIARQPRNDRFIRTGDR